MKITKITSVILSVIAISACSGGGGGSNSTADKSVINKPNNVANTVSKSSENKKDIKNKETEKVDPADNSKKEESIKTDDSLNNIQSIAGNKKQDNSIYELKKLPLGEIKNENIGFGKVTGYNNTYSFNGAWIKKKDENDITVMKLEGEDTVLSLLSLPYTLVGGIKGKDLIKTLKGVFNTDERDIFYFGNETSRSVVDNLKGTAIYKGNATRYDNLVGALSNIGKSIFKVDFDSKKISGDLVINGFRRNISLKETDIKGNGFEGKAVAGEHSLFTTREGRYEGKFFGPNAEEISGAARFEGEANIGSLKDLDTSFSANKQ